MGNGKNGRLFLCNLQHNPIVSFSMLSQNRATVNRFLINVGTKFKFYIIRHILPPPQNDETVSGPITHPGKALGSPCTGEGFSQKYGVDSSESCPLLLTEGGTAQAVTGVEGTRYVLSDCPE